MSEEKNIDKLYKGCRITVGSFGKKKVYWDVVSGISRSGLPRLTSRFARNREKAFVIAEKWIDKIKKK